MPRYFDHLQEFLDADEVEVEVQGEEEEEEWGQGAVVWSSVLGRPGDEQDDDDEILDLLRRLSLGRGVLSEDEFGQLLEIARRRIREGVVALQPLAAGGGDDGRGGATVAVAAPAADDDDDDRVRGRSVLLYYTLRRRDEEGGGGGHGHGGGGGGGGGGDDDDDDDPDPELGPKPTGGIDGEEADGGAATMARVLLWLAFLAAVLACVHQGRDE
jgi:hypothetical protein